MIKRYVLVDQKVVEEPDLLRWARCMHSADLTVGCTELEDGVVVSTIFRGQALPLDYYGPRTFETRVLGGPHDKQCWRYATWKEAERGHEAIVAWLRTTTTTGQSPEEDPFM